MSVKDTASKSVTIMNVRLVNVVQECMPLALLYLAGIQRETGGDLVELTLDADADRPVAFAYNDKAATSPYFNQQTVTIKKGDTRDFFVHVTAMRRPYSFGIAFDLLIGDRPTVQLLRNGQVPFRLAPRLCLRTEERAVLSTAEQNWLAAQRFEKVVTPGVFTNGVQDPGRYSAPCDKL